MRVARLSPHSWTSQLSTGRTRLGRPWDRCPGQHPLSEDAGGVTIHLSVSRIAGLVLTIGICPSAGTNEQQPSEPRGQSWSSPPGARCPRTGSEWAPQGLPSPLGSIGALQTHGDKPGGLRAGSRGVGRPMSPPQPPEDRTPVHLHGLASPHASHTVFSPVAPGVTPWGCWNPRVSVKVHIRELATPQMHKHRAQTSPFTSGGHRVSHRRAWLCSTAVWTPEELAATCPGEPP